MKDEREWFGLVFQQGVIILIWIYYDFKLEGDYLFPKVRPMII